jgi:hypothetical protein
LQDRLSIGTWNPPKTGLLRWLLITFACPKGSTNKKKSAINQPLKKSRGLAGINLTKLNAQRHRSDRIGRRGNERRHASEISDYRFKVCGRFLDSRHDRLNRISVGWINIDV